MIYEWVVGTIRGICTRVPSLGGYVSNRMPYMAFKLYVAASHDTYARRIALTRPQDEFASIGLLPTAQAADCLSNLDLVQSRIRLPVL